MDHRCLYGHRIPEQFSFAIQQRLCPTCGAPCVTLDGYRLVRRLTQEVPLEALAAFNVVRILEGSFVLTARPSEGGEDSSASQQIEVAGTEEPGEPPAKAGATKTAAPSTGFRSRLAGLNASSSLVPEASAVGDAPPPRRRASDRHDTAEAERDFFTAPERS